MAEAGAYMTTRFNTAKGISLYDDKGFVGRWLRWSEGWMQVVGRIEVDEIDNLNLSDYEVHVLNSYHKHDYEGMKECPRCDGDDFGCDLCDGEGYIWW